MLCNVLLSDIQISEDCKFLFCFMHAVTKWNKTLQNEQPLEMLCKLNLLGTVGKTWIKTYLVKDSITTTDNHEIFLIYTCDYIVFITVL